MTIELKKISKQFGEPPTQVLFDIDLQIKSGEFIALTGRSGSGKSTLLYIVSSLDRPSAGEVSIDGRDVNQLSNDELHRFRNANMGFIFQFHYLLPELTAIENVLMPAVKTRQENQKRPFAQKLLDQFNLQGKYDRLPSQLSGGEQQRVAIARSLIMNPRFIFADEPTGNLDSANGDIVMKILSQVNRDNGTTVIFVTHDPDYAKLARRQVVLVDGRVDKAQSTV